MPYYISFFSRSFTDIQALRLKKISFPNGEVIINAKTEERTDLPGSHALNYIQIKNSQGREIKRFDFTYNIVSVGDASEPFSIQSISKVFTLTMVFAKHGDSLWKRVGKEPSGTAFNSLVQLDYEKVYRAIRSLMQVHW